MKHLTTMFGLKSKHLGYDIANKYRNYRYYDHRRPLPPFRQSLQPHRRRRRHRYRYRIGHYRSSHDHDRRHLQHH